MQILKNRLKYYYTIRPINGVDYLLSSKKSYALDKHTKLVITLLMQGFTDHEILIEIENQYQEINADEKLQEILKLLHEEGALRIINEY